MLQRNQLRGIIEGFQGANPTMVLGLGLGSRMLGLVHRPCILLPEVV